MSNGTFITVLRHASLISTLSFAAVSLQGQVLWNDPFDVSYEFGTKSTSAQHSPAGTVSSDTLRHPVSGKAHQMLEKAIRLARQGDHSGAIAELHAALAKEPAAEPYIQNALGVEYMKTRQFAAALASFAQAVESLPHESAVHSNLGLALAASRQLDRAEEEVRRALELDRANRRAQAILESVLEMKHASSQSASAAAD